MRLTKRLMMSADCITKGNITADIGCDHAYTVIYLVREGIVPKAIAMDLRPGPLARAKENIRFYALEALIETRLSDGLSKLLPGEAESILIAGMGGRLTSDILSAGMQKARAAKELVLQPQSELAELRFFLCRNGFLIVEEDMCLEEGKFYISIKAVPAKGVFRLSDMEYEYGPVLLKKKHPVLNLYLEHEIKKTEAVRLLLEASDSKTAKIRLSELEQECRMLEHAHKLIK